ncbi:hypothetical protein ENKNEFLB_00462 [Nocardioides aquaticus]|uniref:DUF4291 domain-containing protein n=1 Tax=Nocardioides aquaticus TaxID=160826 RepID=A0ABX8ECJ8_9ACTN|nr:DUF4291 domain-containing protein [Nocardioides aquaticus]QVT78090.1 hypothetical protein ENKNEFLB_00462 [Nocardioides aquaticus]
MSPSTPPLRQVRAAYDDQTITVYQAYPDRVADAALEAGRFVPPFKRERMTWVKPSFLWMMYRCGWATKPDQERVLAVRITRAGFEEALASSCLSHLDAEIHPDRDTWARLKEASPVRVQWDPERSTTLDPLPWRSIQVGLGGRTVAAYVDEWMVDLTDLTAEVHAMREDPALRRTRPGLERPYPLPEAVGPRIGLSRPLPQHEQ